MFDDDGDEWGEEEEQQAAAQQQRNAQSRGGGVDFAKLRQDQEAQQRAEAAGWTDPAPAAQQAATGPAGDEWDENPPAASQPVQQAQAAPAGGIDAAKAGQIVAMVNLGLEDDAIANALGVPVAAVAAYRS